MDGAPLRPSSPQWRRPTPANSHPPQQSNERTSALPSLNFTENSKVKNEGPEYDGKHITTSTVVTTAPTPALSSPRTMYSGPPPPYSYPSSTASVALGITGYASPPDSRRTSDDDKEPQPRSLPSIHEALGKDHGSLYTSAPPPGPHPAHVSQTTSLSPSTPVPRSHPEPTLSGPPNPYAISQPLPPYTSEPADRRPQPPRQASQSEDPTTYASRRLSGHDSLPHSAHTNSTSSPAPQVHQSPRLVHPAQHPPPIYPPSSQAGVPIPAPGYRAGPGYSFPPPPPPPPQNSFGTFQQPYSGQPYWRPDGVEIDRAEEVRKPASKPSPGGGQHYGESVKRHLDIFDLETSLNEIAEGCGRGLEFTRHFGTRAHQSQRTGLSLASMPSLAECDDMIRRQQAVLSSMTRIREVVMAQVALAEQRSREEASKAHQSDYRDDPALYQKETDGVGAFAADSKRRRGRNAPPGRCHSCNRAETPEWRRGPDGARTLCNACGLHYAKLTRKMGTKAAMPGNSNLRPKENGSP